MTSAPLRIGVDGRAFSSVAGGVRRYVWELYRELAADPSVEIVAIGAPAGAALPRGMTRRRAFPFPTNLGWMAASIPLAARRAQLGVFHAPAYTAPLWGVHPQVLTIHDVSYERVPEWNAYKNDPLRRLFYRKSAHAADRIITDSAFSRSEIVTAYGIDSERIDVVPLAASASFSPGDFDAATAPLLLQQPYALHVGDLHERRNLSTALAALMVVRGRLAAEDLAQVRLPALVCAGIDRGVGEALRAQATEARDPGALILSGPVSEASLLNLYRGASMLLYPSRYEGFGLPVLEAMQCGVPVIGARTSSIPEIAGDAAILVDPLDVRAWIEAIESLTGSPARRAIYAAAGLRRAEMFSWKRTAAETLDVLRRSAGTAQPHSQP